MASHLIRRGARAALSGLVSPSSRPLAGGIVGAAPAASAALGPSSAAVAGAFRGGMGGFRSFSGQRDDERTVVFLIDAKREGVIRRAVNKFLDSGYGFMPGRRHLTWDHVYPSWATRMRRRRRSWHFIAWSLPFLLCLMFVML